MTRKSVAWTAALVVALAVAVACALLVIRYRGPSDVPPAMVPASWALYRTSLGHITHVDSAKVTCSGCHDFEREGFKNPGVAPCAKCHADEVARAHPGDVQDKTDCLTCHAFAPNRPTPKCISCHAAPHGPLAAVTMHATTECAECHKLHGDPAIVPKSCTPCHAESAPTHGEHAGSRGCLDCHSGHAPAAAALSTCSSCHAKEKALQPAAHGDCVGCHKPHEFVAGGANACLGCHEAKKAFLAERKDAHESCITCHAPHAPQRAAESCRGCHADIKVDHGGKEACITCHDPHPAQSAAVVRTCTSCHEVVAPADSMGHGGGVSCVSCHKPHDFSPPARAGLCVTCHAQETTLTSANRGHADCSSCHGASAHKPTVALACGSCHAKEQASAPKGHQACAGCHEPHSGSLLPKASTCVSCHTDKEKGPHESVRGGCNTCHRPHGPSGPAGPPVCATCHTKAALPALHGVAMHTDCAECHTSHGPPKSDRATCTESCHVDRRDHQSGVQVCTGCHVFRR